MKFRDLLLHIDTYPEPTALTAINQAVQLSAAMDCTLSVICTEIDVRIPGNWLTERVLGLGKIAQEEENRSQEAGRAARAHFEEQANEAGVRGQTVTSVTAVHCAADPVMRAARTRDLSIVPLAESPGDHRQVVEGLIFGSGRPTLAFRPAGRSLSSNPRVVVIAWDGSRCAARAVADALQLLQMASEVRILTVVHEKPAAVPGLAGDLRRHLQAHGIKAIADEIETGQRSIGKIIDQHVNDHDADFLVMGAFGHTRLREFVLGGATDHALTHLQTPTLFSH